MSCALGIEGIQVAAAIKGNAMGSKTMHFRHFRDGEGQNQKSHLVIEQRDLGRVSPSHILQKF